MRRTHYGLKPPRPSHVASYASESLSIPSQYGGGYTTDQYGQQKALAQELGPGETLALHAKFARKGLTESNRLEPVLGALATSKEIQVNVVKNAIMQTILLLSALLFEHVLVPTVGGGETFTMRTLFQMLWLWPVTLVSFVISGVGNLRVAASVQHASYRASNLSTFLQSSSTGRTSSVDYYGLTAWVLAESYRIALLVNYAVAGYILRLIPFVGLPLCFAYGCIANSYYLFETRWADDGLTPSERVKALEQRYSYHFGFGFLITFVSFWHSSIFVNLALFSLVFPLILINASSPSSSPVPLSPQFPLSTTSPPISADSGGDPRAQLRANTMIPSRLPILAPAAHAHAMLVNVLSPSNGAGRNATRIRQSRKKDVELDEMEGGEDSTMWSAAAAGGMDAASLMMAGRYRAPFVGGAAPLANEMGYAAGVGQHTEFASASDGANVGPAFRKRNYKDD